jgi:16S rRNA (uracil1498-N3)-methyltransferase
MPVFFIQSSQISGRVLNLTGPLVKHIGGALRNQPGDRILVIDEHRMGYLVQLVRVTRKQIVANVLEERSQAPRSPLSITLAQAILKGKKMDWVLQKATELGVSRIIPLVTERTVVEPRPERMTIQHHRWQKILREAAQQSGRWEIPELGSPVDFFRFVEGDRNFDCSVMPWEGEHEKDLKTILRKMHHSRSQTPEILVLIGPEGGFSEQEVRWGQQHQIIPITLGRRILRAETASLATLTMLQYEMGDMGRA